MPYLQTLDYKQHFLKLSPSPQLKREVNSLHFSQSHWLIHIHFFKCYHFLNYIFNSGKRYDGQKKQVWNATLKAVKITTKFCSPGLRWAHVNPEKVPEQEPERRHSLSSVPTVLKTKDALRSLEWFQLLRRSKKDTTDQSVLWVRNCKKAGFWKIHPAQLEASF